jgi:hypothetical protein
MDYFKNPVILSVSGGFLSVFCIFIENKINKKNRKMLDYLKIFFITFLVIYICNYVYLNYIIQSKVLKQNKESISKDLLQSVKVKSLKKDVMSDIENIDIVNTEQVNDDINNIINKVNEVNEVNEVRDASYIDTIDTGLPDF